MNKIRRNGAWVDNTGEKKRVNGAWVSNEPYKVMKPTISGVPPFSFKSDGENLRDWSIIGQTVQASTPTPSSPVDVSGVGEKTSNLLDTTGAQSGYITADGAIVSGHANLMYTDYIAIPTNTEYITQSYDNRVTTMDSPAMCFYDSTKTYISGEAFSRATTKTFSVPNNAAYIRTCYRTTASWNMLNTGSTALPYEPFGYKIPISCGGTTTNIYLGTATSTRRVKKLVLTGEENVTESGTNYNLSSVAPQLPISRTALICTHFTVATGTINVGMCRFGGSSSSPNTTFVVNYDNGVGGANSFKTYLQQQYAAGTPVTIWYVLATAETAAVNEPLMKIGSYTDELTKTDAGVNIPTTNGSNTLSVSTTIQPSEMSIESISQWV